MECEEATCGFQGTCGNRALQSDPWRRVEVFDAGIRGYGLRVLEPLASDAFVMEMTGVVYRKAEFDGKVCQLHVLVWLWCNARATVLVESHTCFLCCACVQTWLVMQTHVHTHVTRHAHANSPALTS